MRPCWQRLLCWLLAALLSSAGVKAQRQAHCEQGDASRCAAPASCCCPDADSVEVAPPAESACCCGDQEPEPCPAPDEDTRSAKQGAWRQAEAPPRAPPPPRRAVAPTRAPAAPLVAQGPLPKVARRIAYSVWRL